ncbi:MAG: EAL domain-containing protein [Gammaproteobacteria bacterium]|jgi:diguanylate cyclase (GGDEF)-like protein/PAS domain S-box-containing protein
MVSLKRLSLRSKFLVAPAIALLLMALVSTVLLQTTRKQHELLVKVEQGELHVSNQITELFSRLSTVHLFIYDLLVNQAPHVSEEQIYEQGKSHLYTIFAIEKEIADNSLVEMMKKNERSHHANLTAELVKYRSNIISAIEMATVDRDLSMQHIQRATEYFNRVNKQYLMLLDAIRSGVNDKLVNMRSDTRHTLRYLLVIFLIALLGTVVIAVFLSRLLSDDLSNLIKVMGRLASGEKHVMIPAQTSSNEVNALISAVRIFKQSLNRLEQEVYERKCAEENLQLAASVFEYSMEGIMITDPDARILSVNKAFTEITGYSFDEAAGQTPRLLRSNLHDDRFYQSLWSSLKDAGMWQGEIKNRRKNGEIFPVWSNISVVRDEQNRIRRYINIFTDITDKKLSEEHIYRLAHYDALTNLPNRALFQQRLEQALILAKRHRRKTGILFLDLDRFKLVNDTLGHAAGDQLLQQVGNQLSSCVRKVDTVSRLGGDEFVLILEDLTTSEDASQIAVKVLDALSRPFHLDGHDVYVTASAGISLYPDDGEDAKDLFKNADTAMYRAKAQGKNTYCFFTEDMNIEVTARLARENQLRRALDEETMTLHYQPRVDLRTGQIVGIEALLRFEDPQRGTLLPGPFIPIAEDTGLIIPIGQWVLSAVCLQYRAWREQHIDVPPISINMSGRQFMDNNLVKSISEIVDDTGVAAENIEFELTETFLMENPQKTITLLSELKSLGFNIAIDDFGTAYSSLTYLKRFPVDKLKIDRSFISDIPDDPDDIAITKAIIAMARNLNLWIVAEGVETEAQLAFLQAHGCQEVQGYYFSRPLDTDATTALLQAKQPFDAMISEAKKISGIRRI